MRIVILSGKGGTGKTTVAVNLARVMSENGRKVRYVDCDVEEPNGHIFLRPEIAAAEKVCIQVPHIDMDKCTGCGKCGRMCQYNAIVCIKEVVMTFENLCHSCGGCRLVCPCGAISEKDMVIGVIREGAAGAVGFAEGELSVGHINSPRLIEQLKGRVINGDGVFIIDAGPGTSCAAVACVRGADFAVIVTEPTPFGLHDLRLAVGMVKEVGVRAGVVINKSAAGDAIIERYCEDEGIEILGRIDDDVKIAEVYSRGEMIVEKLPEYRAVFDRLGEKILGE